MGCHGVGVARASNEGFARITGHKYPVRTAGLHSGRVSRRQDQPQLRLLGSRNFYEAGRACEMILVLMVKPQIWPQRYSSVFGQGAFPEHLARAFFAPRQIGSRIQLRISVFDLATGRPFSSTTLTAKS